MFNDFLCSRPVIDVPVDAGDDEVVVIMSAKALRIDARVGLLVVGLAVGFVVLLAGEVKDRLVGGIIGVDADMLAELAIVMVAAAAIALEVFVTGSCVGDVRVGVWTGTAIDSDVTFVTRVGAVVGSLTDLLAVTETGFVTGIGLTMTEREFIGTIVSLEDALRFC